MTQKRPNRTLGPGHDEFWALCEQQELHLPRCANYHQLAWPIVEDCELCGHRSFAWERLSGRGTIMSWCTFERDYYAGQLPLPWDCLLIELEEGPLFISNPVELTGKDMRIGLPVQVSFVECEDDAGPYRLPVFARAGVDARPAAQSQSDTVSGGLDANPHH